MLDMCTLGVITFDLCDGESLRAAFVVAGEAHYGLSVHFQVTWHGKSN